MRKGGCQRIKHELGQTPRDDEGQGGLVCCNPWSRKELDTTERLNWTGALHVKTILVIDEYWSIFIAISQHNWSLRVRHEWFIAWVQSKGIAGCTCVKPVIPTPNLTGKLMNLMGDAQYIIFSSVQLLSHVWLFVTPWITARQVSLSITKPRVLLNSCLSSWWCHPAIWSSVVPFCSCPQSLPASESFPMSHLFACGGLSIGVSALASVLPINTQDWSPLG